MSYIVQRKDRFYVVAHDGHDRDEAEAVHRRLELEPRDQKPTTGGPITVSTFLRHRDLKGR